MDGDVRIANAIGEGSGPRPARTLPGRTSGPMRQQYRLDDFRVLAKLGEGTFSEVLKAKHKINGHVYAMKRFRKSFTNSHEVEGLREIQALRRLNPHPNVILLHHVIYDASQGTLALNFEMMDCNLYEMISKRQTVVTEDLAKTWIAQVLNGLDFMHTKGIFHRDIKPENILVKDGIIVKLADFGSCRGLHSKRPFTEYIATRWYRSPECLLTAGGYGYKMDCWGVGCVLFEVLHRVPLFPGTNELDQLHRIHNVLGTPNSKTLRKILGKGNAPRYLFPYKQGPGVQSLMTKNTEECMDLVGRLLDYDPDLRLTAREALAHPFFEGTYLPTAVSPSSAADPADSRHSDISKRSQLQPRNGVGEHFSAIRQNPEGADAIKMRQFLESIHLATNTKTGNLGRDEGVEPDGALLLTPRNTPTAEATVRSRVELRNGSLQPSTVEVPITSKQPKVAFAPAPTVASTSQQSGTIRSIPSKRRRTVVRDLPRWRTK